MRLWREAKGYSFPSETRWGKFRHVYGLTQGIRHATVSTLLFAALFQSAPARGQEPAPPAGDFIAEARVLSRLVACAGEAPLPASWPSAVLKRHCALLRDDVARYRTRWLERTRAFLTEIVPGDLPKAVVYPFGGGDLVTALATFPNAQEITTISLEPAGDIRGIGAIAAKDLEPSLESTSHHLRSLFAVSHSKTTNLRAGARSALPGEIAFALVALSVFDYEPVSLRYVRLDAEGAITYLQPDDLVRGKDGSNPFANVEIAFRSRGDASAPARVYRHFAANLDDAHFHASSPLALHLASKGDVAALVKAASYLLWFDNFSRVRTYLLVHASWMLSDSTGIPPAVARAAGFEQECFGLFHGPMLPQHASTTSEVLALWRASPQRPLPFYFGYPDVDGHGHVMVTRRAGKTAVAGSAPARDRVAGGAHFRLVTPKGPVHVWQPRGYDPATAGTVVYVHGYYTNADRAFAEHALAEQFASSRTNALFVVPEAPAGGNEDVSWPLLADLLSEVERQLPGTTARAPIVVAGHSGAWRTMRGWAESSEGARPVDAFLLLDALYGMEDKLQAWLERQPAGDQPRITIVSKDTAARAAQLLEKIPGAKRRARLPASTKALTVAETNAPVLEIASDLGHMEIITSRKVLPVLLRRSPLPSIRTAAPKVDKPPKPEP